MSSRPSASAASSVSSAPAATTSASNDLAGPASFYRNLFYILIGLLGAFAIVSFLSLLRARRRRRAIFLEAERLGVLVPGIPGYVPIRDRGTWTWTKSDGSQLPDWWDVAPPEKGESADEVCSSVSSDRAVGPDFAPLAIIPPRADPGPPEPIPISPLPFFPNHLAYRAESLLPPPSRFTPDRLESLDALDGETINVVSIIRMPMPTEANEGQDVPEGQELARLWGGVELGITRLDVLRTRGD